MPSKKSKGSRSKGQPKKPGALPGTSQAAKGSAAGGRASRRGK